VSKARQASTYRGYAALHLAPQNHPPLNADLPNSTVGAATSAITAYYVIRLRK